MKRQGYTGKGMKGKRRGATQEWQGTRQHNKEYHHHHL
jgi:hypothetical protein